MDLLKNPIQFTPVVETTIPLNVIEEENKTVDEVEEVVAEEVTNFAEIVPKVESYETYEEVKEEMSSNEKELVDLSKDELFEKLQNYKKLLDNGLILQAEYDALKKEVLSKM